MKTETLKLNLQMFDVPSNVNGTGSSGLSDEMKTYYDKNLLENARPLLVHDQWAQTRDIPKHGGKKIEFRRFNKLPKLTTPLTEGVTPEGQNLTVTKIEAEAKQYGGYAALTDQLETTSIDDMIMATTDMIGAQAGETLDTISREAMNAGTNVQYAEGQVDSRANLTQEHKLTVRAVQLAVRTLKKNGARKINGSYVGIINQDTALDLRNDQNWIDVVKYNDAQRVYEGEIGKIEGVRFVETSMAKIFVKAGAERSDGEKIDVYSTLIFGLNAYATTKPEGMGLQTIIKQKGSGGTSDPLDQRSTIGWKAMKVTEILSQEYMVRIETGSTFSDGIAN